MSRLAFPDQGVVRRHVLPQDHAQTHTVTAGETLAALADRYGVQPQAIRDANPHIYRNIDAQRREQAQSNGGDVLYGGDVLTIPAAPMSVTEAAVDSSSVNPAFPSPNSEYRVGNVTFNPGDGSVKLTAEQSRQLAGVTAGDDFGLGYGQRDGAGRSGGASLEILGKREVSGGRVNKDGNTEFTLELVAETSIAGHAEIGGRRGAFFDGSAGAGIGIRYKVVLKGENRPLQDALAIHPNDPTTIPDGATVLLDGRQFARTVHAQAFNHAAVHSERLDGAGMTFAIGRQGNSVSVLSGPTETVEAFSGAGVRIGDVAAIAGRQDLLGTSKLQAATFDLANPDGQAAYQHFMLTGQIAHETAGVSGVASVQRVDMSSQARLKVEGGPVGVDLAGAQATASFVRTDFPDGSFTQTWNFTTGTMAGAVPLQITSRFDAQGHELLSERTYAFTIDTGTPGTAESLNMALSGGIGGSIQPGDKVTLRFDEGQMRQLLTQTRTARDAGAAPATTARLGLLVDGVLPSEGDTAAFSVRLAQTMGSDPYGFATRLVDVARGADGDLRAGALVPIDATLRY